MADIDLSFGVQIGGMDDSAKNIADQLHKIINDIGPLKVKVEVDTDGSSDKWKQDLKELTALDGKGIDLKVTSIDASGALADFKKQLQGMLDSLNIDNVDVKIKATGVDDIQQELKQVGNAAKDSSVDVDRLNAEMKELKGQAANITKAYRGVINTTESSVNGVEISELTAKYMELQTAIQGMNRVGATSSNTFISQVRQLTSEMKTLLKTVSSDADFSIGSPKHTAALERVNNLLASIAKNQKDWTKAAKGVSAGDYNSLGTAADSLRELAKGLQDGTVNLDEFNKKWKNISTNVDTARRNIKASGEATKSLSDRMKGLYEKFSSWLTVSEVVMAAYRAAQRMVECVVEVDSAMTELKKVTDATDATYDRFLKNATKRTRQLGATLVDTVNATADFSRLGYSIDEASTLADAAIVYKNVADGIDDISQASSNIVSTMQAFGVETSDVMSIVDKFNKVSNEHSISAEGIGDALQKSAAALAAGGNTLDEAIAMITATNRIVQNPEIVGTSMKTVSMYLRSAKTELEEAGESTEGMAESTSKLREEILRLTGDEVDIQFDEDNFKSTYQILKELSKVWGKLTDISRANILEMIGGKRNANVVSALISNFEEAEEVIKTSAESSGSALAENEKYLDSISGRIEKMKASFEAFSTSFVDSGLVKGVISIADALLQVATVISDVAFDNFFTGFATLAAGGGIAAFVKNLD